jgi:hypothetical protein
MRRQKMRREHWKLVAVMVLLGAMLCAATYARKSKEERRRSSRAEAERKVTKAQVPADALATLKRLAAGAEITEFAEEIEHGHTFYEGSWKARSGAKMDVLVTKTGDLVEIERQVGARQVPAAVRKAARKAAGRGPDLAFEKKTMILYEVKFQKGNSRHELLVTPDGRHVEHEVERVKRDEDEDDDDEEVSIGEVPRAVKITILKHSADGKIEVIECEDESSQAVYEVGVIIGGKEMELKVDANGKLVSREIEDDDDKCDDDEDDDDKCDDDEDDDDECDDDDDDE